MEFTAVSQHGTEVVVVYDVDEGEVTFIDGETRIVYRDDVGRWFIYEMVVYRF